MKKTQKVLTIILLAIVLITFTTNVFAANNTTAGKPLDPKEINTIYESDGSGLQTKAGKIMGMIRNVAAIAAVIIIMVLGVKYMLGSVEEKAEYKKSFIPLIIGIVLVVSAAAIASFIFNMAE